MITAVTGKIGGGKTLSSVHAMINHLCRGGIVCTNIRLDLEAISKWKEINIQFLQDRYIFIDDASTCNPHQFPHGDKRGKGKRRVLLVIDESAEFFSSLQLDDKIRLHTWYSWLRHSDKIGTDVFFIVQDFSQLNKQGRLLSQRTTYCYDMDKFKLPIIFCNPFFWTWGKIRIATYDTTTREVIGVQWIRKEKNIFSCYDTADMFGLSYFSESSAYDNLSIHDKSTNLYNGIPRYTSSILFIMLITKIVAILFA